jgi:hypothetical protein
MTVTAPASSSCFSWIPLLLLLLLLLLLCRFNEEFNQLVKQKHKDADRLADLASRMDELIKELVKIHMMLAPAPAAQPSSATVTDQASAGGNMLAGGLSSAEAEGSSGAASGGVGGSAGGPGSEAEMSGSELSAQLGAGRLVAHWSPLEELEEQLLAVKPGEVKVSLTQSRLLTRELPRWHWESFTCHSTNHQGSSSMRHVSVAAGSEAWGSQGELEANACCLQPRLMMVISELRKVALAEHAGVPFLGK